MFFTKKQKGAISVFLTLVLLPVMIFGFMTTDAARIYSAKVVVSDAGEMAMNAALAQFDDTLFDKYGLLAMKSTPESMQQDLETYFVNSLNGSGITGASGYEQILTLLEQNFEAISVDNTQVYQTEIEKQQILEYMKYRAPVCLTELVLEKLKFIKDSKKILDAMNKEMDFAEEMEECQDAFEDAKNALDALNDAIQSVPSHNDIEKELLATQMDFTTTVARCLLMRAAIQEYNDKPSDKTVEEMINSYIVAADKVNLDEPYSEESYSKYLDSLYYDNGIQDAGGTDALEGDENTKKNLIERYEKAKNRISNYNMLLLSTAKEFVSLHYNNLNNYYNATKYAKDKAQDVITKLDYVREKLLQTSNAYDRWDQAVSQLDEETAGDMKQELEENRYFSGNDREALGYLQSSVEQDQKYFTELQALLTEEKMYDRSIATTDATTQVNTYNSKAKSAVNKKSKYYDSLETIRQSSFVANYYHTEVSTSGIMYRIDDDPFYLKLKEYCAENDTEESQEEADKANKNLDEGAEGADAAKDDSQYPSYDWSQSSQPLPSVVLEKASFNQASQNLTDLNSGSNVKDKSSRKNIIAKMKTSINEASNFLDGVNRIIENNIENLYISEYAMQMFSYYTCDKKMQTDKSLKELTEDENISISGYKLKENKGYKGEIEYILWGNQDSKKNIQSTVMLLFGVRLLFNSIYAFTDNTIRIETDGAAVAIAGAAPYLVPVIKIALKFGIAAVETSIDIGRLKDGYGVAIFKTSNENNFQTINSLLRSDVRNGTTFDYGEWLRVFLNVQMLAGKEENVLARIGDCIQINTDTDITKGNTMMAVQADVGVKTSFMQKIADWADSEWNYDDMYMVQYKSVLGY